MNGGKEEQSKKFVYCFAGDQPTRRRSPVVYSSSEEVLSASDACIVKVTCCALCPCGSTHQQVARSGTLGFGGECE